MTLRTAGAVGVGAIGLTLVSVASPAAAAPDCGPVPAGATLTVLNSTTCQLEFTAAGAYTWTVPTGAAGLSALLLGGGSGSGNDETIGYAGEGGLVAYRDYSAIDPGEIVDIVVGAGGASFFENDGDPGEETTTTIDGSVSIADGGATNNFDSGCEPEGDNGILASNGDSASTNLTGFLGNCEDSYAAGLTASSSALDSYGNARPALFDDYAVTLGAGGRILVTANPLLADAALVGTGNGSDIHYTSATNSLDGANGEGGSGRVVFRYTTTAIAPALAATGVEAAPVLTIAALTAGLGAVLLAMSRRRKRA